MKDKLVVVVGGTGKLGRLIVESLLTYPDVRVRVLVRDPSKPNAVALAQERVEISAFDAVNASETAHADAVRSAFAVVSAVQGGPDLIIDAQLALLRAAKKAGARRFIPSDYAFDLFSLPEGINVAADWRRTMGERARNEISESFDVVHVLNGMFLDRTVLSFIEVFDAEKRIMRYWGDGKTPIDLTTWEDTAAFTAAAALDDREVPERLFISGARMDILALAKTWESVKGEKLTIERLGSLDDLERAVKRRRVEQPENPFAWLPLMYARGVFGGQALLGDSHNARYPSIKPESIAQAIARGAM